MRLICPNCAARYEVDGSMIPAEGRDVQCSSCGHTWFQRPDEAEETLADEPGVTARDPALDVPEPEAEPEFQPEPEPEPEPESEPEPIAPRARPIDEAAREILRQEAAREVEARRREGRGGLESQAELGLDDTAGAQSRATAAKARLARLRKSSEETAETETEAAAAADAVAGSGSGTVAGGAAATVAAAGSRRELLPDIEEINSTLTATGDRAGGEAGEEEVQDEKSRRGFRFGFAAILTVVTVLILLYLFAPRISGAVPALAPAMAGYLGWANGILDQIDGALRWAVEAMRGLTGASGTEG